MKLTLITDKRTAITTQDKLDRIARLSEEIDANEDDSRLMMEEITRLYAEIYAHEGVTK